ncbi:MAG: hypothetical protein Q7W51_05735 [Coriobacteriia bacterium]|nr:hypothetical protein [Coriobacteriia bacterium]
MTDEKVRENKVRRAAERQGLKLVKSRRRDPRALDFDKCALVSVRDGRSVFGRTDYVQGPTQNTATLEDCERYLDATAEFGWSNTAEFKTLILSAREVMERWDMDEPAALRILGYHPLDDFQCMVDAHGNLYWTVGKVQKAEAEYGDLIAAKDWDGFVRRSAKVYRLDRTDPRTGDTIRGFQRGENLKRPPIVKL